MYFEVSHTASFLALTLPSQEQVNPTLPYPCNSIILLTALLCSHPPALIPVCLKYNFTDFMATFHSRDCQISSGNYLPSFTTIHGSQALVSVPEGSSLPACARAVHWWTITRSSWSKPAEHALGQQVFNIGDVPGLIIDV